MTCCSTSHDATTTANRVCNVYIEPAHAKPRYESDILRRRENLLSCAIPGGGSGPYHPMATTYVYLIIFMRPRKRSSWCRGSQLLTPLDMEGSSSPVHHAHVTFFNAYHHDDIECQCYRDEDLRKQATISSPTGANRSRCHLGANAIDRCLGKVLNGLGRPSLPRY
jgi:hypothetical protein